MADLREPEVDDDADEMDLFMVQTDDELHHHADAFSDPTSPTSSITEAQTNLGSVDSGTCSIAPASSTAAAPSTRKRKYSGSWQARSSPQSPRWSPYEGRTAYQDDKVLVRPERKRVVLPRSASRSSATASTSGTRRDSRSPLLSDTEPVLHAYSKLHRLNRSAYGSEGNARDGHSRSLSHVDGISDQVVMSEDDLDQDDDYNPDPEEDEVEEPIPEDQELSDEEIDDLPLGMMLANNRKILSGAITTTSDNQPQEPTVAHSPALPQHDEYDTKLSEGTSKGAQDLTWRNEKNLWDDCALFDTRVEAEAEFDILHEPLQPPWERLQDKAQSAKAKFSSRHAAARELQNQPADIPPPRQPKHGATPLLQPLADTQTPECDIKPFQPSSEAPQRAPIPSSPQVPAPRSNVPSISCHSWVPSPPCSIAQQSNGAVVLGLGHSEIMYNLARASSFFLLLSRFGPSFS